MHPPDFLTLWRTYLKRIPSPESFIEASAYYVISAALQRRVWTFGDEWPVFPNLYVILVGDPGTGKDLVITPSIEVLKFWKLCEIPTATFIKPKDGVQGVAYKDLYELQTSRTQFYNKDLSKQEPNMLRIAPNSVTFEQLLAHHDKSVRIHILPKNHNIISRLIKYRPDFDIYPHKTICFALTEISSLFNSDKSTSNIVDYLLCAFDCKDYDRETKGSGCNNIKDPCLSFLAGTTPDVVEKDFSDRMIGSGFTSRVIFLFENEPRFDTLKIGSEMDDDQRDAKFKILNYVKSLLGTFGPLTHSDAAMEKLNYVAEVVIPKQRETASKTFKNYLARKKIHLVKLSMIMHYLDPSNLNNSVISFDSVLRAEEFLNRVESKLHLGMQEKTENHGNVRAIKIIYDFMCEKGDNWVSRGEVWEKVIALCNRKKFEECMEFLCETNKVEKRQYGSKADVSYKRKT